MTRWRARGGGLVVCGVIAAGACSGFAQEQIGTFERILVSGTAVGIATTTTNPTGRTQMNTCYARVETASLRFRDDGTDPTADIGTPLDDNDMLTISGNAVARRIRFIRSATTSPTVSVRCYP